MAPGLGNKQPRIGYPQLKGISIKGEEINGLHLRCLRQEGGLIMFRYCYVHKGIFGIKRPLLNFKETSGICKRCLPGELEKLRKFIEGRTSKLEVVDVSK